LSAGLAPSAESVRTVDNEDLNLGPCLQPWQTIIVLANGNVRTCCGMDYSVGNINEQKLIDIANGDAARDVREKLLNGTSELPCNRCWAAQANTPESFRAEVQQAQEKYDILHPAPAVDVG
jgi:radical SAM protein with 4Fe4S-binding SPASM domain